jgi:hypothetical protein
MALRSDDDGFALARDHTPIGRKGEEMRVRRATALAAIAFTLSAAAANAGPCTDRIFQTDLDVAKVLDAAVVPGSVAGAEQQAGDFTSEEAQEVTEDMDQARHADDEGDRAACEKALGDVDRLLRR